MPKPTNIELTERLAAVKERNIYLEGRLDRIDSETLALAAIVEALKPFDKTGTGYSYSSQASISISRILTAAAARFGIRPDWEIFERLGEQVRLTDQERNELIRLRAEWDRVNRA
jgi:hypothetical protein